MQEHETVVLREFEDIVQDSAVDAERIASDLAASRSITPPRTCDGQIAFDLGDLAPSGIALVDEDHHESDALRHSPAAIGVTVDAIARRGAVT
jgi:hypothetical protein